MKLVMDERLKHRLVGVLVIVSIAAIFVPAIMKKSNQRFDSRHSIAIKMPPKPALPEVNVPKEQSMFQSIKVAHVEIAPVWDNPKPVAALAKAEPLSQMNEIRTKPTVVAREMPSMKDVLPAKELPTAKVLPVKEVTLASQQAVKGRITTPVKATKVAVAVQPAKKAVNVAKTKVEPKTIAKSKAAVVKANLYSVQLATFSQQSNAISLVNRLKSKGFKAFFNKTKNNNGTVYRVLVGRTDKKQQAQALQQQLASSVQLKGFIVPTTGIS